MTSRHNCFINVCLKRYSWLSLRRTPPGPGTNCPCPEIRGNVALPGKLYLLAMNTRPRLFNLFQTDNDWNIVTGKWNYFLIVQSWSNVHDKYTFTASWSKRVTVYPQTFCNLVLCKAPTFPVWGGFPYIKHFSVVRWWFQKCPLSILYRGVCLIESIVTVK